MPEAAASFSGFNMDGTAVNSPSIRSLGHVEALDQKFCTLSEFKMSLVDTATVMLSDTSNHLQAPVQEKMTIRHSLAKLDYIKQLNSTSRYRSQAARSAGAPFHELSCCWTTRLWGSVHPSRSTLTGYEAQDKGHFRFVATSSWPVAVGAAPTTSR